MASMNTTYTMNELPKDSFVIDVKIGGRLRFRLWLATRLIRAAGFVLNAKTEVNHL